jgi:hypothetical protein
MRVVESVKTCATSGCRCNPARPEQGVDERSGLAYSSPLARGNRKQAHSNPSRLECELRRRRAAILIREHGLHHDRPVAGEQRALAKARCRSGTSFAGGEGQRSFADGFRRKEQRLAHVVSLEVGV